MQVTLAQLSHCALLNVNELKKTALDKKRIFDNGRLEKSKQTSSTSRAAILTLIESVEQQYNEACTGKICKKLYELVHFLRTYDVNKLEFSIHSDMQIHV